MPSPPDWNKLLDPWAGGPGDPPGYRETVEYIRQRGPLPKPVKKAKNTTKWKWR